MAFLPGTTSFMKSILYHRCARPWYVYVETSIPALIELVITVTIPDFNDLVRARGEGIVSAKPGPGGRRKRHLARPVLGSRKTEKEKYARGGLKFLLTITKPLEFIGFTFLLYFAIDRFFYNWQIALDNTRYCTEEIPTGPLIRSGSGFRAFPSGAGGLFQLVTLEQNRAGWGSTNVGCDLPEGVYSVILAATIVMPGGASPEYAVGLNVTGSPLGGPFIGSKVGGPAGEQVDLLERFQLFYPLIGVNSISWGLFGPQVPIGVEVIKARVIIQRVG